MNWTSRSLPGKEHLLDEQVTLLSGVSAPVQPVLWPFQRPEERNQPRATSVSVFFKGILFQGTKCSLLRCAGPQAAVSGPSRMVCSCSDPFFPLTSRAPRSLPGAWS